MNMKEIIKIKYCKRSNDVNNDLYNHEINKYKQH